MAAPFAIGPCEGGRFKASRAREIIAEVLKQHAPRLKDYNPDNASAVSREIADTIKLRLKAEDWPRYKFAVQVLVSEQRGESCRMACRCFWDQETDSYAFERFENESVHCVAAAFAAYIY